MVTHKPEFKLIDLAHAFRNPLPRKLFSLLEYPLEKLLSVDSLNRYYTEIVAQYDNQNFFATTLKIFNIDYELAEEDSLKIPPQGPLFVIANHPFGGVDGVVLGAILTSVRPDVKLLANHLLNRMPEIRPWLIAINPFGGKAATKNNIRPMVETLKWLKRGGVIGTFPSGTVSHLQLKTRKITDPPWSVHIAAIVRHSGATVLPVYFEGRNSSFFQLLGMLHPYLRTALLPHEMVNKACSTLKVRVGKPIAYKRLASFAGDRAMVDYLRLKTYVLKNRDHHEKHSPITLRKVSAKSQPHEPLAPPVPSAILRPEVERLPSPQCLITQGDFDIYYAYAQQIPRLLEEIGRLREKTFREVGEGLGKACILDSYDRYYIHLFMWNRVAGEIVGGYRMGPVDTILREYGKNGLYTSDLFKFKAGFLENLDPALELGRSFIRQEYQRKHASLALIWRGIGEYIARHPTYKILFGPVSISKDYTPLSKNLMVHFLKEKRIHPKFACCVKAKHPPRSGPLGDLDKKTLCTTLRDIDDVSALVSEIETDRKGIPILLRHYLKLNGTLLSFNIDRDFAYVLDGLILVDVTKIDPPIIKRYMGAKGYEKYCAIHGLTIET